MELRNPIDMPILYILGDERIEPNSYWLKVHEDMLMDIKYGKLVVLEGSHFHHHTQTEVIATQIYEFINELSTEY